VSEFLGWLSYPVYCLHRPVFNELSLLAGKGQAILHIPVGFVALAATLVLAVVASMALDHAGLQRKITMLLSTKSARPTMAAGN
jgi:peptidoglycan/LPS O-acetylase OafA/YrhL